MKLGMRKERRLAAAVTAGAAAKSLPLCCDHRGEKGPRGTNWGADTFGRRTGFQSCAWSGYIALQLFSLGWSRVCKRRRKFLLISWIIGYSWKKEVNFETCPFFRVWLLKGLVHLKAFLIPTPDPSFLFLTLLL